MKKKVLSLVAVLVCIFLAVVITVTNNNGGNFQIAGGSGKDLKTANEAYKDTTKVNVVTFAQANATTEGENLFQVMNISNWEHQYGKGLFAGADFVGTASTQFGVMAATLDARCGYAFEGYRMELKTGKFTRNGVTTSGFDPQFSNACILAGEAAPVSNAMQLTFTSHITKVYVGNQNGSEFYKLDGSYYIGAEQKVGNNIALSANIDFAEQTTGCAAAKWQCRNSSLTLTCNKLGSESQNFVLSYVHSNIPIAKGTTMNVASALWKQPQKSGLQIVAGLRTGRITLFAQAGGYVQQKTYTPTGGLGLNYNM